jgi:hypothetical protein
MQAGQTRSGGRDARIDWLRGLAMICVIVNHSRLSSLFSWFSYERLWVVTAAEVFLVLSGVVLGIVYRRRLDRHGWAAVVRALGRRAMLLYASFTGVTISVLALALIGVDVSAIGPSSEVATWFYSPQTMDASAWRDVLLMRAGPWPFEIIGLYVWLVAMAVPCLLMLRWAGWRWVITLSWTLYFWYQLNPHPVTRAGFESAFPLLAWQLLFVHGITIGYHRDRIGAALERTPRWLIGAGVVATVMFAVFAFCNPWTDGPTWLHLRLLSPERFADLYNSYFGLQGLGAGRLFNLAVGLSVAYAALTRGWSLAWPLRGVLITLGQRSLGAFALHVYAVLLLAYLPVGDDIVSNTLVQAAIVIGIAAVLSGLQRLRALQEAPAPLPSEPLPV